MWSIRSFGFIAPKHLNIIWQYLSNLSILSATWWSLFQKRVVRTNFDIYVYIIVEWRHVKLQILFFLTVG
jgi:hypothetical protein